MTNPGPLNSGRELRSPDGQYEQFLYSVSHDLQEPLRMITSFLKLLENVAGSDLNDDAKEYLNYGLENADRMKRMIYALVELSRVNRSTEPFEEIDMNSFISDIVKMYGTEMKHQGATIVRHEMPNVEASPTQMMQLFRGIIQNAFDNVDPKRSIQIDISGEVKGEFVEYRIEDNGRGINAVYLDKVFEIFKRIDPKSQKVGAGLAIAREIVKRHGGTINIESTEGVGTIVTFRLLRKAA
jgi:light-regulated signal transduction histidine kinase (bacteriophytochrome)